MRACLALRGAHLVELAMNFATQLLDSLHHSPLQVLQVVLLLLQLRLLHLLLLLKLLRHMAILAIWLRSRRQLHKAATSLMVPQIGT